MRLKLSNLIWPLFSPMEKTFFMRKVKLLSINECLILILFLPDDRCADFVKDAATKLFDVTFSTGSSILSSVDPFAKALEIFGNKVVSNSLSKVLATQCSGVFGVFTSLMPNVSIIPIS